MTTEMRREQCTRNACILAREIQLSSASATIARLALRECQNFRQGVCCRALSGRLPFGVVIAASFSHSSFGSPDELELCSLVLYKNLTHLEELAVARP